MGECGAVPSKLTVAAVGGVPVHLMFSMKSSLTHPQEAVGRARRLPDSGWCVQCLLQRQPEQRTGCRSRLPQRQLHLHAAP